MSSTEHPDHGHHDHSHDHDDDRPHEHGHLPLDAAAMTERGMRASLLSFLILLLTAAFQLIIVSISGSVALLSDTIHNFADASTAIPLWIAFKLSTRPPTRRFTYGLGRLEDVAGLMIVLMIASSAVVVAYEAVDRLLHPQPVTHIGWIAFAAVFGFIGNEAVAIYRIKIGRQIGSAALMADGYHARMDGITSLAVLISATGIWLGYPIFDPLISVVICIMILKIAITSGKPVILRLMDGIDPNKVDKIKSAAQKVEGIIEVTEVRLRWIGHRLLADANIAVESGTTVDEAHAISNQVRHELLHELMFLSDITIHVDPSNVSGERHHRIDEHRHGRFSRHSH